MTGLCRVNAVLYGRTVQPPRHTTDKTTTVADSFCGQGNIDYSGGYGYVKNSPGVRISIGGRVLKMLIIFFCTFSIFLGQVNPNILFCFFITRWNSCFS